MMSFLNNDLDSLAEVAHAVDRAVYKRPHRPSRPERLPNLSLYNTQVMGDAMWSISIGTVAITPELSPACAQRFGFHVISGSCLQVLRTPLLSVKPEILDAALAEFGPQALQEAHWKAKEAFPDVPAQFVLPRPLARLCVRLAGKYGLPSGVHATSLDLYSLSGRKHDNGHIVFPLIPSKIVWMVDKFNPIIGWDLVQS